RRTALVPRGGRHGQSVRGRLAEAARAGAGGVERARLRRGGRRSGAGGGADRARPRARRDRAAARGRGAWAQCRDPAGPAGADGGAWLSGGVARGAVVSGYGLVATMRQLLKGVLPWSGVNSAARPAASKRARRASASGYPL